MGEAWEDGARDGGQGEGDRFDMQTFGLQVPRS